MERVERARLIAVHAAAAQFYRGHLNARRAVSSAFWPGRVAVLSDGHGRERMGAATSTGADRQAEGARVQRRYHGAVDEAVVKLDESGSSRRVGSPGTSSRSGTR